MLNLVEMCHVWLNDTASWPFEAVWTYGHPQVSTLVYHGRRHYHLRGLNNDAEQTLVFLRIK